MNTKFNKVGRPATSMSMPARQSADLQKAAPTPVTFSLSGAHTSVSAPEQSRIAPAPSVSEITVRSSGIRGPEGPRGPVGADGPTGNIGPTGPHGGAFALSEIDPYIVPAVEAAVGNFVDLVGIYQLST